MNENKEKRPIMVAVMDELKKGASHEAILALASKELNANALEILRNDLAKHGRPLFRSVEL